MDTLYSTGGTSYKIDPCQSKFFDPSLVVPEHQEPYEVKHMSDTEKAAFITSVCESRGSYIDPVKAQAVAELLGSIYSPAKEESKEETTETNGTEETEENTDSEDNSTEKSEESAEQPESESNDSSTGEVTDEEKSSTDPVE
jgi:hypothetical protein